MCSLCDIENNPGNDFRKLVFHPESDSLWEIYNENEFDEAISMGIIDDVTDIEKFEKMYIEQLIDTNERMINVVGAFSEKNKIKTD